MKATSYIPHIDDIRPYWEQVTEWIRDHLGRELELLTCGYDYVIYPDAEVADISFDIPEHDFACSFRLEGRAIFYDSTRPGILEGIAVAVETVIAAKQIKARLAEH